MKTLLCFLFSAFCFSANAAWYYSGAASGGSTSPDWMLMIGMGQTNDTSARSAYLTAPATDEFTSNTLYVAFVSSGPLNNTPTFSGAGMTWTHVGRTNFASPGSPIKQFNIFVAMTNNFTTGRGSANFGENQTACCVKMMAVYNVNFTSGNGLSALVQTQAWAQASSANPSNLLAALSATASNAVLAGIGTDANPLSGTAETGWTEFYDSGVASPATGLYVTGRIGTTDNSVLVTAGASEWGGYALEVQPQTVTTPTIPNPDLLWIPVVTGGLDTEPAKVGPNLTVDADAFTSHLSTGYAMNYNGTSDDSSTVSTITPGTNCVSISLWMNADAVTSTRVIAEASANYNNTPFDTLIAYFDVVSTTNTLVLGINEAGVTKYRLEYFPIPSLSAWHHVVMVWDNRQLAGDVKLYVDAAPITGIIHNNGSTKTLTNNFAANTFYFGARGGTSLFYDGRLEDIRFFKGELTAATVTNLYQSTAK